MALRKSEMLDIADTNMALFGTQLEKDVKAAAAECEQAWDGAGKEPGVRIWRVEKFQIKDWPVEEYGKFYTGDSYIMLHSIQKEGSADLIHHILFWLGRYTTQDEAGTAAYKTVELDDRLGGVATQHREVQGHESKEFFAALEDCPGGPRTLYLMEGGIETGFRHAEPEKWVPRLLHVCRPAGRRKINIREVPCCLESFDRGDVFLLDTGKVIYQWNGASANPFEKSGASEEAGRLASLEGRPAASHQVVDDDGDGDMVKDPLLEFVKAGGEEQLADIQRLRDITEKRRDLSQSPTAIYRLSDASGDLQFEKVSDELKRDKLSSEDAFVVDGGEQVYVWVGSGASVAEKKQGLHYAQRYLKDHGRNPNMPIATVKDGRETAAFAALVGG